MSDEKDTPDEKQTRDEKQTSDTAQIKVTIPRSQRIGIKIKPRDIKTNTGAVVSRVLGSGGAVEKAGTVRPGMLLAAISEVNVKGMDTSSIVSFLRHRHKISDIVVTFVETANEKKEESEITNEKITPKKEEITLKKEESPPKKVEENSGSWQAMWGEKEVALPADHSPFSSKRSRRGSIDLDEEAPKIISDESSNIEKIKEEVVSYESLIEKSNLLEKSMKGTDDSAGGMCSHHPCQNVSSCLLQSLIFLTKLIPPTTLFRSIRLFSYLFLIYCLCNSIRALNFVDAVR